MRKGEAIINFVKEYPRVLFYPGIVIGTVGCVILAGAILSRPEFKMSIPNAATPTSGLCPQPAMELDPITFWPNISVRPGTNFVPCPTPTPVVTPGR